MGIGVTVDGMEDGAVLGTNDGQLPHVALQVWKKPGFSHLFVVADAHDFVFFFKIEHSF